jgi:hypothetical protein
MLAIERAAGAAAAPSMALRLVHLDVKLMQLVVRSLMRRSEYVARALVTP